MSSMASHDSGVRCSGWIRNFRDTWGFARSNEFEGDIFVGLKSNPHLASLSTDDVIEFEVKTNDNNKMEAVNVTVTSHAQPTSDGETSGQRYTGVVRNFRGEWGFITSESIEGDLFVGLKSNPHLHPLVAEDQVTFEVRRHGDGKQEAIAVQLVHKLTNGTEGSGGPAVRAQANHLVGQKVTGWIKSFKGSWGFVQSELFTGDLFLHARSNPSLGQVFAGDPVQFEVVEDEQSQGGTQARNAVVVKDVVQNLVGETLHGWVKSFSGKWGFLNSSRFDGDLFVGMGTNMHLGAAPLMQNEIVQFQVAKDEKSGDGCHAVRVRRVAEAGGPTNTPSFASAPAVTPGSVAQWASMMGFAPIKTAASLVGATCTGEVRSYKDEYGFAISNQFAGDIFVGAKSNPHLVSALREGDKITFTVRQNGTKVEAVNVQVMGSLSSGGRGARDRSRTPAPMAMNLGLGRAGRSRDPVTMVGQTLTGWVRSFKGSWGFVNSSSFDGDVFVGKNSNPHLIKDLKEGDKVRFSLIANGHKAEAVDVQVVGHAAPAPQGGNDILGTLMTAITALSTGQMPAAFGSPNKAKVKPLAPGKQDPASKAGTACLGVVRKFRGDWGFITSDSFDGDLFVGHKSNPQLSRELKEGDKVQFVIAVGTKGKAEAEQVRIL